MTWFEVYEVAARKRQGRLAGRVVEPPPVHVWVDDWCPVPTSRPDGDLGELSAGTSGDLGRGVLAYRTVADRVDSVVARSVGWLLSRTGFGGPMS